MVKINEMSIYDPGGILKHVHDKPGKALRVVDANTQVPAEYSKVILSTNVLGSVVHAAFYRGTAPELTTIRFTADVAGSLNSKYWLINSAEDATEYYIWYDVDGLGTDPALSGKCGIQVNISANDTKEIVCLATKLIFELLEDFEITSHNNIDQLIIGNYELGQTTPSMDVDTGFDITEHKAGVTVKEKCVDLPQVTDVKYVYNHGERKFEVFNTAPISVTLVGSTISSGAIQNVSAPVAGTEYSFTLALNVRRFEIRTRNSSKFQFSFIAGQSGTNYRTVAAGNVYEEKEVVLTSPLTLYFQTNKNGEVLEIVTYS